MDKVYVTYADDGVTINGYFANPQDFPTTEIASDDASVVAFLTTFRDL